MAENRTLTEFRGRYLATDGIESVEMGEHEGSHAIIVRVGDAETFDATSLPAAFSGYTVLIDDGTRVREARGPLV